MCLEHAKTTPEGGTVTKTIYNDANVRKLLYYGYGGADSSYWGGDAGTTKARVITTLALDTAYGSRKGHKNSNAFYKWATAKPDPGIRGLYFSSTSLSTQRSDTAQWTNATTVMGTDGLTGTVDSGNDNVVVHNETTGKAGRSVSVKKGDSIYLSASPHYTGTVNLSGLDIAHAGTYQAIVWVTESTSHQDLGQLGYVSAPSVTTSLYAKFVGYNKDVTSDKIGDDIDSRIDGSVLELVDESGKVVDRWTSDSQNPHSLPELLVGGKYTIREVSEKTNISAYVLRYYEKGGVLPRIDRSQGGSRRDGIVVPGVGNHINVFFAGGRVERYLGVVVLFAQNLGVFRLLVGFQHPVGDRTGLCVKDIHFNGVEPVFVVPGGDVGFGDRCSLDGNRDPCRLAGCFVLAGFRSGREVFLAGRKREDGCKCGKEQKTLFHFLCV